MGLDLRHTSRDNRQLARQALDWNTQGKGRVRRRKQTRRRPEDHEAKMARIDMEPKEAGLV